MSTVERLRGAALLRRLLRAKDRMDAASHEAWPVHRLAAVSGVSLPVEAAGERALPAAIAEVLTGLLLVMTRRKAVSLLIGLFVFENGLAIVAFALTFGMPLVVEMGILFDLLIAVGVGWITTRRMIAVTGTASTDELRRLRG